MPEELWMEVHDIVEEAVIKPSPRERKANWLSEEALQIAEKKREAKGKGDKKQDHLQEKEMQKSKMAL